MAAAVCELARPIRHSPLNWLLHGGMRHMWCRLARLAISFIEDIEFDRFRFVGCSVCCNRIAKKLNHLNESSKLPAANNVCVTLESMPKLNRALCYGGCVNCVSETVQIGGNWILQTTTKKIRSNVAGPLRNAKHTYSRAIVGPSSNTRNVPQAVRIFRVLK